MISEIKTQFYKILTEDLKYNVCDNPNGEELKDYPYLLLTLQECKRERYKDMYSYTTRLKIDIFSNYNGEKEILDMEEAIFNEVQKLWNNEMITYFNENSFRIIDDKSTGIIRKHGIINYVFYCTGGIEDDA